MTLTHDSRDVSSETGVRLYRFTVAEYRRMAESGVFQPDDPIELIDGLLSIKSDVAPPYGVPVGIPPDELWSDRRLWGVHPLRKITAGEYEKLIACELLDPSRRHELVDGWVVEKMTHKPRHDFVLSSVRFAIERSLPAEFFTRIQMGLALDESTPEPDLIVVRAPMAAFADRHPSPHEAELVTEVADATLAYDLGVKCRSYARNAIREYWVIDVRNSRLHVFSDPSGPTDSPAFAGRAVFERSQQVTLRLGERAVVSLDVSSFFPAL